jgi:nickel/cobalt exporter
VRRLVLLALTFACLVQPAAALAHPLGNFTVNRYSRVELSGDRLYVLYVLDMAEIPAFQERQRSDDPELYARTMVSRIERRLDLTLDGRPIALRPLDHVLGFPPGAGDLRTLRLQALYASDRLGGAGETARLAFQDGNFADRIGWKEVVVRGVSGAEVRSASVPSESISGELLAYPDDLLASPPDVNRAEADVSLGATAGPPPALLSQAEADARVVVRSSSDGGFAALVSAEDVTPGVVLVSLFVALFWGAAHALSPGHGKALVTAYLVGTRGTPRHAVLLGLIVTVTHTIGVFALGLVTLALSEFVVPERLYPWLNLVSALLVVGVGVVVLRWRLRDWRRPRRGHHHGHEDDHGHDHHHGHDHGHGHGHHHGHDHGHHHGHDHGHGHHHHHPHEPGLRGLVGMGISGGIIPCPTALVVLLAAISLHRIGYGLVLIVAFSVGLAATITVIGLLALTAKRRFSRMSLDGPAVRLLPNLSAALVLTLGLAMTARAIPGVT